jgi:signal recognition particle receptor subunit beta
MVVTGPFAAGKTTFIRTISEITVLSTERAVSSPETAKTETTVAMDFGRIRIDRDLVLYLFGTPGQERFDFMWEILGEGMLGFVLLIDATRPESLVEAATILPAFRAFSSVPYVVALNRAPQLDEPTERWVRDALRLPLSAPVVGCDAVDRESVKGVLLALLYAVLGTLEPAAAEA